MNHDALEKLDCILEELKQSLKRLVEVLQEEREAIIDFDLQKVKAAYMHKHDVLIEVESLEAARQEWVRKTGRELVPGGLFTIEGVLSRLEDSQFVEHVRDQLSCIRSIAQAAQEFNECQRQYLAHSLNHIQSSLLLLDSLQGKGQYQCYTKTGNMMLSSEARLVVDRNL